MVGLELHGIATQMRREVTAYPTTEVLRVNCPCGWSVAYTYMLTGLQGAFGPPTDTTPFYAALRFHYTHCAQARDESHACQPVPVAGD